MYEHLFSPITINGMTLKNRIIAAPTGDLFEEKATGGAALVIAGHAIVEPGKSSFASKDEPWLFDKYEREETYERVMRIHAGGAKASIEIFHGGADARTEGFAKGPCDRTAPDGTIAKAMTITAPICTERPAITDIFFGILRFLLIVALLLFCSPELCTPRPRV